MAFGFITGTGALPASATPVHVRYYGDWTSSGRTGAVDPSAPALSAGQSTRIENAPLRAAREVLQWLHEASGLTWDQLGRLFGVSRRSVHHWTNGARMNAHNAETLLATDESGMSVLDRYRRSRALARVDISGTPYKPAQLIDAYHDPVEAG